MDEAESRKGILAAGNGKLGLEYSCLDSDAY